MASAVLLEPWMNHIQHEKKFKVGMEPVPGGSGYRLLIYVPDDRLGELDELAKQLAKHGRCCAGTGEVDHDGLNIFAVS